MHVQRPLTQFTATHSDVLNVQLHSSITFDVDDILRLEMDGRCSDILSTTSIASCGGEPNGHLHALDAHEYVSGAGLLVLV